MLITLNATALNLPRCACVVMVECGYNDASLHSLHSFKLPPSLVIHTHTHCHTTTAPPHTPSFSFSLSLFPSINTHTPLSHPRRHYVGFSPFTSTQGFPSHHLHNPHHISPLPNITSSSPLLCTILSTSLPPLYLISSCSFITPLPPLPSCPPFFLRSRTFVAETNLTHSTPGKLLHNNKG